VSNVACLNIFFSVMFACLQGIKLTLKFEFARVGLIMLQTIV